MAEKEIPWFYHPDLHVKELLPEEARHAVSALRLLEGDRLVLTNGHGETAEARITRIQKGRVEVRLEGVTTHPPAEHPKTLIVGRLHHADRLEWLMEKVQELGLDRLTLVDMDNCHKGRLNLERLHRIAISGLKQSHQAYLCRLEIAKSLEEALQHLPEGGVFGYLGTQARSATMAAYGKANFAVIGPEADFSDKEVSLMLERGLQPVTLGATRLRAETAALAAAIFLQIG